MSARADAQKSKAAKIIDNLIGASVMPNDPKLSHGAKNRKREFAAKLQMQEQPPLAPARC
jgi:hypothetical protein